VRSVEWVLLSAGLAVAAALVIGAISWRLWTKVRRLGREVSRASEQLAAVQAEIAAGLPNARAAGGAADPGRFSPS
jgi:uncharacterized membrane protein YciS (DUF1049 family)